MQILKFIFQEENDKTGLLVIVYFIDHFTYKTVMIFIQNILRQDDNVYICIHIHIYRIGFRNEK